MSDNEVLATTRTEATDRLNLYWNGLTYKAGNKTILNDINGEIISGQLTGILGPSGSGKTTLIECLAGKRRAGLSGRVWVKNSNQRKRTKLRISYNCQTDALMGELTVEEALGYASELKKIRSKRYDFFDDRNENYRNKTNGKIHFTNGKNDTNDTNGSTSNGNGIDIIAEEQEPLTEQKFSHKINVQNMIQAFGLDQCAKVRTASISGGQKKRLSIALELIFSPNILLLDEPTTGLDSVSSFQCLSLLKTLSYNKDPLVIAASIHQPTARLLSFFDNIYVLALDGNCIYSGPTDRLVAHLYGFGLICPVYHNPADFVIEISSGGHSKEVIDILANHERQSYASRLNSMAVQKHEQLRPNDECQRSFVDQLKDMWILSRRSMTITFRNPMDIWLRLAGMFFSLAAKLVIYSKVESGATDGGCTDASAVFARIRNIATNEGSVQKSFKNLQNITYIMTLTMFVHFCCTCPTLMTFPIELATYSKEHFNKWYTRFSYFMARSLVDVPAVVIIPLLYATILWFVTDQIWDVWRFSVHLLVILLVALVSHSMGLLLSTFFINNIKASLLSFSIVITPFLFFSGFLIPIRVMPVYLQKFSYLSIFRLSYESMLIILYGFGRCPQNIEPLTFDHLNHEFGVNINEMNYCLEYSDPLANVTHNGLNAFNRFLVRQHPSRMLDYFSLQESDLYIYITLLALYSVVLRTLAYYALKWRVKIK